MCMSKEPYTIRYMGRERNEDGDVCFSYDVLANGFAGVRAYNADQRNRQGQCGKCGHEIYEWTGTGDGVLVGRYIKVVDATEWAIEAANDEWASRQQEIEDAAIGSAF